MITSLSADVRAPIEEKLARADQAQSQTYPGDPTSRQPVHTLYGGAQLFKRDSIVALGRKALESLKQYANDPATLAEALEIPATIAEPVYERVISKLEREPVEDYRIDFEDGFGYRSDAEEDSQAERTARELASDGSLPPFVGIRIKPLTPHSRARSIRTLDIFLSTLLSEADLPTGFVVTLPKVVSAAEVTALSSLLGALESAHRLNDGSLKIELMIETPQAIVNSRGEFALPQLIDAAQGRCRGAHFGTYDYTASLNITAAHQNMLHPACDYARQAMLVCLAQRGLFLSDGATNILPISRDGDAKVIHRAWRLHSNHIRHSLKNGFYQGWDLHPAQLPSRYATVYAFFLEELQATTARLKNFVDRAAQATLAGDIFDDAATGQGLLNFFLRGLNCGALTQNEVLATGLTVGELQTRSFAQILAGRGA